MDNPATVQDLEWDDDDESFKSAVEFSLAQSFLAYSTSKDPLPMNIGTSYHSDFFVDALSEEESDDDDFWWKANANDDDMEGFTENTRTASTKGSEKSEMTLHTGGGASLHMKTNKSLRTNESNDDENPLHTISSYAFNQDRDCIIISTTTGYQIQTLEVDPNEACQIHKVPIVGGVSHIEILHRTSLLAIVKNKTPRSLSIIHARTAVLVKELSFTSAIRRVEMNRICMLVLTANGELHCFVFKNGDVHFVQNIPISNENESARMITADAAATQGAFFELSPCCLPDGQCWAVTKSAEGIGFVSIYKIYDGTTCTEEIDDNGEPSMELVSSFSAHNHSIARVAIGKIGNDSNEYSLATASVQGTIVRVFRLPQGDKIYELHRGSSAATIFSLAFNFDASVLAVSSSKGTVHLFHLCEDNRFDRDRDELVPSSSRSIFSKIVGPFKPKSMDDSQQPFRSYAKIRIKDENTRTPNSITLMKATASCAGSDDEDNLVILFENGRLFQFVVPRKRKGKSRPVRAEDLLMKIKK